MKRKNWKKTVLENTIKSLTKWFQQPVCDYPGSERLRITSTVDVHTCHFLHFVLL